jgi:hypothetical protein
MTISTWRLGLCLLGLAATGLGSSAFAQQPITGITVTDKVSAAGTIKAIDPANRSVTVTLDNGPTVTGRVNDAVGGFGLMKVGDRISAGYEQKIGFVLSAPGASTPANAIDAATATSRGGELPAGASAVQMVGTWTVVKADPAANTISLVNPAGGQVRTFEVQTPEGRSQLTRVKPGDKLTMSYSDVVFGVVTRRN